jgi:putative ABC transport system ATP-binding protein
MRASLTRDTPPLSPRNALSIALEDVRLTLTSAAGPVNILNGVSLAVKAGEAVALLGPSGSGKSSLLMVAAGLETASAGKVSVAGRVLTGLDEDALARFRRKHVGIVFQSFHLIPTMTALENVAVPLELLKRADAFARAGAALVSVGLSHRLDHYPGQLSGGEQQRVALARAIVHDPGVLFADEPTGNLDGATGTAIVDLLFALRARANATLFLVTHEEALAARCDRILRMKDGLIVAEEHPVPSVASHAGI